MIKFLKKLFRRKQPNITFTLGDNSIFVKCDWDIRGKTPEQIHFFVENYVKMIMLVCGGQLLESIEQAINLKAYSAGKLDIDVAEVIIDEINEYTDIDSPVMNPGQVF